MFSKHLIGQGCTEKYYMVDIIAYNPDQSGQGWKNKTLLQSKTEKYFHA